MSGFVSELAMTLFYFKPWGCCGIVFVFRLNLKKKTCLVRWARYVGNQCYTCNLAIISDQISLISKYENLILKLVCNIQRVSYTNAVFQFDLIEKKKWIKFLIISDNVVQLQDTTIFFR